MNVIVDTNLWMAIVQFKIDVFKELKNIGADNIYVLDGSLKELLNINRSKIVIKILNDLIKSGKVKVVHSSGPVDSELIRVARESNLSIATNDKEIIKRSKKSGIKIIRLRQKKFLTAE